MTPALDAVVALVEKEGERLRAEFYRAEGPRGRRGNAPIDLEIEERLRAALQPLVPSTFAGEESGTTLCGSSTEWVWLVDPQDGTYEFLSGRRGSAISVALLRAGTPVLAVVHSPISPDCGRDTIAWREGEPLQRNGRTIEPDLSRRKLSPGELVWATASSALRPATFSRAVAPARYVAMPSIAYRLARVAAGDGVAAISLHGVQEYDIAAGLALVRAAGGVTLDAEGREVTLAGNCEVRVNGCFSGAPQAVSHLVKQNWGELEGEPRRAVRVPLGFPRKDDETGLARAQGALLGLVIGDSLASGAGEHAIAGQPVETELALVLARTMVAERGYVKEKVQAAYRDWLTTRPIDVALTTERGLLGLHTTESESKGSLVRVAPIGILAAGDPARAARIAREDSALTHPNPVVLEACAAFAAAISVGVAGGTPEAMLEAARSHGTLPESPADRNSAPGALKDAFSQLKNQKAPFGAIAGALRGAARGRDAIPAQRILEVLACRALAEAGAPRPRPSEVWPDDLLELAEALLLIR